MRRPDGRMLLGAAKRFFAFLAVTCGIAFVGGLLLGHVLHEGNRRGIAIGFYITGMALAGAGFLLGSRPPVRSKESTSDAGPRTYGSFSGSPLLSGRVRWATREEHRGAMNLPAVLIAVGISLLVIGAFVDGRHM